MRQQLEDNFNYRTPVFDLFPEFILEKQCSPDWMHQIDIGIFRTLFTYYLWEGKGNFNELSGAFKARIKGMIFTTSKYIHVKLVARIPRDYYLDKWKAAECRVFITFQLVILGMMFDDNLPIKRICHLLFHIIRKLESPTILNDQDQVDLLYSYCVAFLRFTSTLFGEDAIALHFHSLLHFSEFA